MYVIGTKTNGDFMTTISLLLTNYLHEIHAADRSRIVVARRPRRLISILILSLGVVLALWGTTASAQSHTIYLLPQFLFDAPDLPSGPTPYETTVPAAWADVQATGGCRSDGNCYTYSNLTPVLPPAPNGYVLDGNPYLQYFDQTQCDVNNHCNTTQKWSFIQTSNECPVGGGIGDYNYNNGIELIACALTVSDVQPPPKDCKSCLGNPIYAATGLKLQAETDYPGLAGLNFTRTYRSDGGYFSSVLTQAFVDGSTTAGTVSQQCYPGTWTLGSLSGVTCYPYISVYPYVNSGVAQYQLQTDDGRSIQFTGPNSAVTAKADINERVTQLNVNGAVEWQVKRGDDMIEIYNATGALIQKTLRGGQTFTYTYSTSSTPTNIAPHPGLLLTQSDAFGHTLSWQYNANAQVSQMTDPAGGIYQYSYDATAI
jgi:YD repeat-containing protein